MFIKVLLASVVLMAIVFVLMAIGILIKKNGKFPGLHIGSNKEMQKRGISCATTQDRQARNNKLNIQVKSLHLEESGESHSLSC